MDHKTALSTMTLPIPITLPTLTDALKPVLATKQFGSEHILAALVAEAALAVMPTREQGFRVDDVRCVYGVFFLSCFLWCVVMKN
jgi:T-complex protein 1 subunit theta